MNGFEKREWDNLKSDNPNPTFVHKLVGLWEQVFRNPLYDITLAQLTQVYATTDEIISNPMNIRDSKDVEVSEDGMKEKNKTGTVKEVETAYKILALCTPMYEQIKTNQESLLPEEVKRLIETAHTHRDLRKEAFSGEKTK